RGALRAERPRVPLPVTARRALLDEQPSLTRGLPVLLVHGVELRERLRPLLDLADLVRHVGPPSIMGAPFRAARRRCRTALRPTPRRSRPRSRGPGRRRPARAAVARPR